MYKQDSEINQNMKILNERLIVIEKINNSFKLEVEQMEKDAKYSFHKDSVEVNKLKTDIIEIKKKIKNTIFYLRHLVNELKLRAKKEEFESVRKKIESLGPYSFVTEKEAKDIIKGVIEPES